MQDCGRSITDYTPNCQMNEYYKFKYAPGSSSEYRQYLIHNACSIMDEERQKTMMKNENPTGCKCNYNHPPHDVASAKKYHWRPSPGFLAQKNKDFGRPLPALGQGRWTNYC